MQTNINLSPKIHAFLVKHGDRPLAYVGARNSATARMTVYMDALGRAVELPAREGSRNPNDAFGQVRAGLVENCDLDLDEGEIVCLTDAATVKQWWSTLHDLRLAAGTPRQPTFRHRPTAVGRI